VLIRALTAFYVSLGGFAAASFFSLLGAICVIIHQPVLMYVFLSIALCAGVTGVLGLLTGAGLLVWESRCTLAILREEVRLAQHRRPGLTFPSEAPEPRPQA